MDTRETIETPDGVGIADRAGMPRRTPGGRLHERMRSYRPSRRFVVSLAVITAAVLLATPLFAHAIILIPFHGAIAGVVRDTSGTPLPQVIVTAYEDGGPFALLRATNSQITTSSGTYVVPALATGRYRLQFVDLTGQHAQMAYPSAVDLAGGADVTATDNATTTIDATLGPAGFIAGTVSSATTGGPIMGASVNAWRYDPYVGDWLLYGQWMGSDTSGNFRISGLAPGAYRVWIGQTADFHYAAHWLGTAMNWPLFGADVTVTAGTTTSVGAQTMAVLDDDGFEPSDTAAQAKTATLGTMLNATIYRHDDETPDVDFFAFNVVGGHTYEFATYTMAYTWLELFDRDGMTVLAVGPPSDDVMSEGNAHLTWMAPATGRYFVRVRSGSPYEEGPYSFKGFEVKVPVVTVKATLKASAATVKAGRRVLLGGRFSPSSVRGKTASLQKLVGRSWRTVKTFRIGTGGSFSMSWTERTRGTRRFRVMLPASTGFSSATSPAVRVRWT